MNAPILPLNGPTAVLAQSLGSPLRIGVLTFHRCINYGSYWQARCLVEGLRALGHWAELLDHACAVVTSREWRCAMQPLLPRRSPRADIRAYAAKTRAFEHAFDALPRSPRFPLAAPDLMGGYDLVVVGSDEVWNFAHPWYGGTPLFFGTGLDAPRIVSYAASFGNHDAAQGIAPEWAGALGQLAGISVRDDNSRRLVTDALGREPALVLDPCLQFPPELRAEHHVAEPATDPYVLVYGHGFPERFAAGARAWADARGLRLVSVGYRNDFAHEQRLEAGPEEFAALVAGATAVVTNFFHGCVFALVGAKPFAATTTPYRHNKLRDLTSLLGAERHLLGPEPDADAFAVLDQSLAPAIAARLADMRARSADYLAAVLG